MSKKEISFEEKMERLEEITGKLENNEVSLNESLQLFEEGIRLIHECNDQLKAFETKTNEILKGQETVEE